MRSTWWIRAILIFFLTSFISGSVWAGERENKHPIGDLILVDIKKIKNGINYIDLNGDGNKDMVVCGHRHNISAHSFQVCTIYIYSPLKFDREILKWQIVTIKDREETYVITTNEGADCVLRDIRLVKLKDDNKDYLVIAERLPTEIYTDKEFVVFKFYRLYKDDLENRYIYEKMFEKRSNKKYCDVNEAFSELKK